MSIATSFLPEFDREMAATRRALQRVPAEKFDWRPHPKSYCLGALALHLANVPSWFSLMTTTEEIDFASFPPPRYETPSGLDAVLAKFDAAVAGARAALEGASDERMHGSWTGRTGEKVHFTRPRTELLRDFVISHSIHHRGQLTVYLRLLDVPVPMIYGPTADETGA